MFKKPIAATMKELKGNTREMNHQIEIIKRHWILKDNEKYILVMKNSITEITISLEGLDIRRELVEERHNDFENTWKAITNLRNNKKRKKYDQVLDKCGIPPSMPTYA